jgi:putative hemolysin
LDSSILEDPPQYVALSTGIINNLAASDWFTLLFFLIILVILIMMSAMISSTENAFFSLTQSQTEDLTVESNFKSRCIEGLIEKPKNLLATILIGNTFINISIVMISSYMLSLVFNFEQYLVLGFIVEVVLITFIIVLFGEVMPKIYAAQNNTKIVLLLAIPMYYLQKSLSPFVWILVKSTSIIDKRITKKGRALSADELSHAIDITTKADAPKEETTILKSIVNFGHTDVKQIMKQRPDVSALDSQTKFNEVLNKITNWGYSRVPVYKDNLDNIIGILYIKDLLPHIEEPDLFDWVKLLRKPYFVPESKKIDDLLKDFQNKRVHLAIIIDEFGGTSGMVTMEDILEEIFGEINDEFDEDEVFYSKINDNTFVFEAKILINDMCRYMQFDTSVFDDIRNDADTLGGMLLEINGEIPLSGEEIRFKDFLFVIESVDTRKIKRVKVILEQNEA